MFIIAEFRTRQSRWPDLHTHCSGNLVYAPIVHPHICSAVHRWPFLSCVGFESNPALRKIAGTLRRIKIRGRINLHRVPSSTRWLCCDFTNYWWVWVSNIHCAPEWYYRYRPYLPADMIFRRWGCIAPYRSECKRHFQVKRRRLETQIWRTTRGRCLWVWHLPLPYWDTWTNMMDHQSALHAKANFNLLRSDSMTQTASQLCQDFCMEDMSVYLVQVIYKPGKNIVT